MDIAQPDVSCLEIKLLKLYLDRILLIELDRTVLN